MTDRPSLGPADLPQEQLTALRNLARKQAGEEVDWINIAAARALSELGLAHRSRQGWEITPEGAEILAADSRANGEA
jgi:hypothetical protein